MAECDGAVATRVREERRRLVIAERKSSRMMESRGMESINTTARVIKDCLP